MGRLIIVEGRSGTGKSTSWRNMPPEKTVILTPNSKPLPFPKFRKNYKMNENRFFIEDISKLVPSVNWIVKNMTQKGYKYILIDDFTHFITRRTLSSKFINDTGFEKWAKFGADVLENLVKLADLAPEDWTIVVNSHTSENKLGFQAFATAGKLMGDRINVPSWATYVLHSRAIPANDGKTEYLFQTNIDEYHEAKTPVTFEDLDDKGNPKPLFEMFIPNDIYAVIKELDKYEFGEEEEEEVKA